MTFKETIENNIKEYGHHVTVVMSDSNPRYAYTIGVKDKLGFELIFAGGIYFMKNEIITIINSIIEKLEISATSDLHKVNNLGSFQLFKVHHSWSNLMALGVFDYYKLTGIEFFQIMPDYNHYTLDVPNMTQEWVESAEPIWCWLVKKWNYPVAQNSKVTTNINSMKGEKITEVVRWEEDEWEGFVGEGDKVKNSDIRVVPLATLLGIDRTLLPILNLKIGQGLWRDVNLMEWENWNS